jgi:hypothetical protein
MFCPSGLKRGKKYQQLILPVIKTGMDLDKQQFT